MASMVELEGSSPGEKAFYGKNARIPTTVSKLPPSSSSSEYPSGAPQKKKATTSLLSEFLIPCAIIIVPTLLLAALLLFFVYHYQVHPMFANPALRISLTRHPLLTATSTSRP